MSKSHGIIFLSLEDLIDHPGIPYSFDFLYWSIKNSYESLTIVINHCDAIELMTKENHNAAQDALTTGENGSNINYDIMALLTRLYNLTAKIAKKIYADKYLIYDVTILLDPFCGHEPILLPQLTHVLCDCRFDGN